MSERILLHKMVSTSKFLLLDGKVKGEEGKSDLSGIQFNDLNLIQLIQSCQRIESNFLWPRDIE